MILPRSEKLHSTILYLLWLCQCVNQIWIRLAIYINDVKMRRSLKLNVKIIYVIFSDFPVSDIIFWLNMISVVCQSVALWVSHDRVELRIMLILYVQTIVARVKWQWSWHNKDRPPIKAEQTSDWLIDWTINNNDLAIHYNATITCFVIGLALKKNIHTYKDIFF